MRNRRISETPESGEAARSAPSPTSISGATVYFALSYGAAIAGYLIINALAARLLGEHFGFFVMFVTVSSLFGQLGLLGVHRGGLRDVARLTPANAKELARLRRGVRAISLVVLPSVALMTAATTFIVFADDDQRARWAIAINMACLVWLSGQQKLWASYLRGFGRVRFASLLEGRSGGALTSLCQAAFLAAVLSYFPSLGISGALASLSAGYCIPVAVAWRKVWMLWRHVDSKGSLFKDLRRVAIHHWRFASSLLAGFLNSSVELFIAGFFLSSLQVSLFGASQRLAILLVIPLTSLGVVYSPVVARLFDLDRELLEKLLRTGATIAAFIAAVGWIPMFLFPGLLLRVIYGDGFSAGTPILMILTIGSLGNIFSGLCGTALTMSGQEKVVANVQWAMVVIRVVTGCLSATLWGVIGLAMSATLATSCLYGILWVLTFRRMGVRTHLTIRPSLRLMRETSS